jgi:hypothetical protein
MTEDQSHEQLLAILTPTPDKPWCSTFDCPGCEHRHLRKDLERYGTRFGADTLDQQLTAIYLELSRTVRGSEPQPSVQGFRQLVHHAAELLPRPILAKLQLKFLLRQIQSDRVDRVDRVASAVLSTVPFWPELCDAVRRGLRNPNEITVQTVRHLQEYAAQLVTENEEVQA